MLPNYTLSVGGVPSTSTTSAPAVAVGWKRPKVRVNKIVPRHFVLLQRSGVYGDGENGWKTARFPCFGVRVLHCTFESVRRDFLGEKHTQGAHTIQFGLQQTRTEPHNAVPRMPCRHMESDAAAGAGERESTRAATRLPNK